MRVLRQSSLTVCVFLIIVGVIRADDGLDDDEDAREMREYRQEEWHAVASFPANEWVPKESDPSQFAPNPTKRRRLRKRKRRPPVVSYVEPTSTEESETAKSVEDTTALIDARYEEVDSKRVVIKKRKRPYFGEPWDEVPEESNRPYVRRKVTPAYAPDSETAKETDTESTTTRTTHKLKDILKQNGGLSLSEILQRKNVTLTELLMGKTEAIKALSETASATPKNDSEPAKYKRLPPSIALHKNTINRKDDDDGLTAKERADAQKKRQSLLLGHNNGIGAKFAEVTRYEVIMEPTTEKRIYVPYNTYKANTEDVPVDRTESYVKSEIVQPETTHFGSSAKPPSSSKAKLPITSAKLLHLGLRKTISSSTTQAPEIKDVEEKQEEEEEENYPKINGVSLKPLKINVNNVFGYYETRTEPEEKISDGPLKMSIDLTTLVEKVPVPTKTTTQPTLTTTSKPTTTTQKTTTEEHIKLKPFTAKEEILEILKDPHGRDGLARILEARNMTIQELIDQRERGSSQLHLSDIFHNKKMEPEPSDEDALEGQISAELFSSFPVFNRQSKSLKAPENLHEDPLEMTTQNSHDVPVNTYPSFKIQVENHPEELSSQPPSPSSPNGFPWHDIYPDLFRHKTETTVFFNTDHSEEDPLAGPPADILTEEDIQRLEFQHSLISSITNMQANSIDENNQRILSGPSGVKSAIVASLVIVGLSMFVFITILITFRWLQKKKRRLCGDRPSLLQAKSKNIKTFMAETLNKKRMQNYYKRQLQSMTDSWDRNSDKKNIF